jgi:ketosteroid isomerase-like protein
MAIRNGLTVLGVSMLACTVALAAPASNAELNKQVADSERAFAATMKARDHAAFVSFVADDAVFFNGPVPLHGKAAVGEFWKKFYGKGAAPFSWEPDQVEVLASGTLAMTSGPVYNPAGKLISRFNSVWRRDTDGKWKVVFDRGEDVCDCKKAP